MRYTAMPTTLWTPRLNMTLRDEHDAEWNRELLSEHDDAETESLNSIRDRMASQRILAEQNGIGLLAIRRRTDNEPLGYCGLIIGRCTLDEPEIACELFSRFHNQGYGTEAARAVIDAAFATGRRRIWATVGGWNQPSLRVAGKVGYQRHHDFVDDRGRPLIYLVQQASSS
jgi:RimJ/RimL family protein N-acetyltransferase